MTHEMRALPLARDDRGFTLVEVMVTMLILVIGISGSIALIDGANARTDDEGARGRQRAQPRGDRGGALGALHEAQRGLGDHRGAIPGLADSTPSTTAWTVVRRKQTYTVTMSVCSVDDGQDGFGDKTGGNFCSSAGTGSRPQPGRLQARDGHRDRTRGGTTRSVRQAGIVNNEASSAGPDVEITGQDPDTDEITTGSAR